MADLQTPSCPLPHSASSVIRLGHGSGGSMSSNLIESVFMPRLGNEVLQCLDDAAQVDLQSGSLAITTDSYVVSPIFFPGGDIGSLSVHGTINDLAMRGARPLCITAAFILEEGLQIEELSRVLDSMAAAARQAAISVVAADTKVVGKGAADKIFITTTGIGLIEHQPAPAANRAREGDCIIVSGDIGRHGMAIMSRREGIDLETDILSDSAALHKIVQAVMDKYAESVHCMRDVTRGGLASVLNEIAEASRVGIEINESEIPAHQQVSAVCELLGLDPLYVACEGRFVLIAEARVAEELLTIMKGFPDSQDCRIIGKVINAPGPRVVLRSKIGGNRILSKLSGEQLPRIC